MSTSMSADAEADRDPIFYFDFGSPNACLAHRVIPGIETRR